MLNNRTLSIRSGLLCLAVGGVCAFRRLLAAGSSGADADSRRGRRALARGGHSCSEHAGGALSQPAAGAPTEAEREIDLAITQDRQAPVGQAKIEQDVEMLNQKFKITGNI